MSFTVYILLRIICMCISVIRTMCDNCDIVYFYTILTIRITFIIIIIVITYFSVSIKAYMFVRSLFVTTMNDRPDRC